MSTLLQPQSHLAGVVILAGGLSTRMGSAKAQLTLPSGKTLLDYHVHHAQSLGVPVLIADNGQGFTTQVAADDGKDVAQDVVIRHIVDYQPSSSQLQAKQKHSAGPLGAIVAGMQQLLKLSSPDSGNKVNNTNNTNNTNRANNVNKMAQWLLVVSCDSLVNAGAIWQYFTELPLTEQGLTEQSNLIKQNVTSVNKQIQQSQPEQPQVYCLADNERIYPLLALYQLSLAAQLQQYLDAGERRVMGFIQPISQPIAMPVSWHTLSNLNTPEQFKTACQQVFGSV